MLNQLKSALQTELDSFFAMLGGSALEHRVITAQAFSKARHKIRPETFEALNKALQTQLDASGAMQTWQGFRLLAVDGSGCHVPLEASQAQWFGASQSPVSPRCTTF